MKKAVAYIVRFSKFLLFVLLGVVGYFLYKNTLIDWFIPLLVGLGIALATLRWQGIWSWMTDTDAKTPYIICHLLAGSLLGYVLFLGANVLFADTASTHVEQATVRSKHIEIRKKSNRVGKHYHRSNVGSTKYYYLQVVFPNGTGKLLTVRPNIYNATKVGAVKPMTLRKGLFGFPVIIKSLN